MGPEAAGLPQLQQLFQRLINLSVGIAFIATTIMLVVAGIRYITSGGEPKSLAAAHQTVTWALLGIIFMASAWLILKLIEAFSGVRVTDFCLGFAPYCLP